MNFFNYLTKNKSDFSIVIETTIKEKQEMENKLNNDEKKVSEMKAKLNDSYNNFVFYQQQFS